MINLYKPQGITSAKAVYRVRRITRIRKSGHAGTLDPAADGVLVVCLGRATRLVEQVMDQPKVYLAAARLDVTSESHDSDGPVTTVRVDRIPTREEVRAAMQGFEGTLQQVPPDISAVKVGGQEAYKLVRRGERPQLGPRPVVIYWLHLHAYDWPTLEFEMACGRGTYVRSLIRDLGERLGTGGCLTRLTRKAVGPFTLESAWTFERLEALGDPVAAVIPLEQARALLAHGPTPVPPRPE